MKKRFFFLYLLTLILFSQFSLYSQNLSENIFYTLKKNNFSPESSNLVNSNLNSMPFNIVLNFPSHKKAADTLLIVFAQEDFEKNSQSVLQILSFISRQTFDFNINVLLAYGDYQKINMQGMIFGSQKYLSTVNTSNNISAILINFDSETSIITNSNGISAPSWLIKNEFDLYLKHGLGKKLPFYYISQMYSFSFFYDQLLSFYFENEIPAIKLCLNSNELETSTIQKIISESIISFSNTENKIWDHHFLIIKHFKSYAKLSEKASLKIILIVILIWLFFILMLFFINQNQKNREWQRLKTIWYIVPITFLVVLGSLYLGKSLFLLINPRLSDTGFIFSLFSVELFLSFFAISVIFITILVLNKKFEERTIDYLIVLSCFFNQSLFILIDISLFPIFMTICLLSLLALFVKNNTLHIILLIFMILPFLPYIGNIIKYSDITSFKNFIISNRHLNLTLSLVIFPILLDYFRILTFLRSKYWKLPYIIITTIISVIVILLILIFVSFFCTRQINKRITSKEKILYTKETRDLVNFSYSDKKIFSDTIRTINIDFLENCEQCNITILGNEHSPILYTDNDFENSSANSIYFLIPNNPPKNMTFTYGFRNETSQILITAVFPTVKENQYSLYAKTITIREEK